MRRLRTSAAMLAAAMTTTLAVAGAWAGPTAAAPGPAGAEAAPVGAEAAPDRPVGAGAARVDAEAVATYRGVHPQITPERAAAAAAGEKARHELYTTLAADTAGYGGAWFDAPSGVANVAVTTAGAADRATALAARLGVPIRIHRVARSLAALEAGADALRTGSDQLAKAAAGRVGFDVRTNSITVAVDAGSRLRSARALAPPGVTLVAATAEPAENDACTSRAACDTTLRAGVALSPQCSLGFTARSAGVRYVYTAGHCSTGNGVIWSVNGRTIGPMIRSRNSFNVDAAMIQVTNSAYTGHVGGEIYDESRSTRTTFVVGTAPSFGFMTVGERVCLSAHITQPNGATRCGVLDVHVDPRHENKTRVRGMDACPGDSGGGWYWPSTEGNWAYGLHSSSDTGCFNVRSGKFSWFSPMFSIYNFFPARVETR